MPLPDLAAKDDLREVEDDVARVDARLAQIDARVVNLDAKVDLLATQFKSDRDEDRRVSRVRHYWLAGIGLAAVVPIWLGAAGVIS
ncbi:hypothetical protein [Candidatus Poriferisodalis sp.]|uniref:hypothetical protein n=1 Tax=Candidatus Poriferisodalis sp. TaxID=3101277 RepID=UPI003B01546F